MLKKTIRDIDIDNKRVLVRVDFNVPAREDGAIADDYRIKQALPTIEYLLERNCRIILLSHRGRPEQTKDYDPKTSTKPAAARLGELLGREVQWVADCVGDAVKTLADHLEPGQLLMLENVRYHNEEEENSEDFARAIIESTSADVFVQDGFGVVHRAHSSTDAITRQGRPAVAGLLLEKEVDTISSVMDNPKRPLMVIVGGAKIREKINVLRRFIETADVVVVVGALANTFLLAQGHSVGTSLAEPDDVELAKEIMNKAHERASHGKFSFYTPRDVVVAREINAESPTRIVDLAHNTWADITTYPKRPPLDAFEVGNDEKILDIGPISAAHIAGMVRMVSTLIWNGTCGVTEVKGLSGAADPFAHGTRMIVEAMTAEHGEKDHPFVVVGGGDTVAFVEAEDGLRERLGHVSTGGGASLELMEGKHLPGIEALNGRDS